MKCLITGKELRIKEIMRGWEDTMFYDAIEFTPEMAEYGLYLLLETKEEYPDFMLKGTCHDVIDNFKNGEITYIDEWMFHKHVNEIIRLNKLIK